MKTQFLIQTKNLTKQYGKVRCVNSIDLQVPQGSIYGFLGPNGAGKSTTLKMILGLAKPTAGSITLFGTPVNAQNRIQLLAETGSLIESPSYYGHLTGEENLHILQTLKGCPEKDIDQVLQIVRLDTARKKKVNHYSLGMKQRLGLALALMNHPDFLILDEPINGLDPEGVAEFRQILRQLNQERQTTILISSHILSELSNVATRYGFMEKGRLLEEISAETLHDKCRTCLRLEVDDAAKAAAILQTQLGTDKFEVLPGNVVQLYDCLDDPKRASYALAQNGVALLAMEQKGADLEAYFLDLIGGGRHV